uniref:Uncharacterized protein n=1 Tax=Anguilla anguilla TaxID=7936 RepID=A0A0E9U9W7_ANGAN
MAQTRETWLTISHIVDSKDYMHVHVNNDGRYGKRGGM